MSRQILKVNTKEVLYEKYRTEKLLARRATAHISDEERQRLLEGSAFPLMQNILTDDMN